MKFNVGLYTIEIRRKRTYNIQVAKLGEVDWEKAAVERNKWVEAAADHAHSIMQRLQAGEFIMCPFCNVPLTHAPAIQHTCMACLHGHCELVGTSHT